MFRGVLALALACVVGGGQDGATEVKESRSIRLVAPGKEPRAKLRFMSPLNSVYTVRATFHAARSFESGGKRTGGHHSPEVVMIARAEAVDYPDSGGTLFSLRVTDVEVRPRPGAKGDDVRTTREYFEKERGREFSLVVGVRGQVFDFTEELTPSDDQLLSQMAILFQHAFLKMGCWVPADDVGVGAKWTKTRPSRFGGVPYVMEMAAELEARNGPRVTIREILSGGAKLPNPDKPKEDGPAIESVRITGSVRTIVDLTTGLPAEVEYRETLEAGQKTLMESTGKIESGKQSLIQSISLKIVPEKAKGQSTGP